MPAMTVTKLVAAALSGFVTVVVAALVVAQPPTDKQGPDKTAPVAVVLKDAFGDPLPAGAIRRLGSQRLRHGGAIASLAWATDSTRIASAGGFTDQAVRLWDAATGKQIREFKVHRANVTTVALAPVGELAASVDAQGRICVWDISNGKVVQSSLVDDNAAVVFAGDGKSLISIEEGQIRQYECHTGRQLRSLPVGNFRKPITYFDWSKDGKTLAATDNSSEVRILDVTTAQVQHTLGHSKPAHRVNFAPDGKILAVASANTIHLWDTATGKPIGVLQGHEKLISCLSWSPDGTLLASASQDWTVRLWDVAKRCEVLRFDGHQAPVASVAFSPDSKRVASGGDNKDPTVRIWEAATGKENPALQGPFGWVGGIAMLSDTTLLTADSHGTVCLWDVASWQRIGQFSGQQSRGKAIAISPDRKLLATGTAKGVVRYMELPSGREILQFQAHDTVIQSLAFSPDGKLLITHGKDNKTWVWNAATAEKRQPLAGAPQLIYWFAFSDDSKTMYTAGDEGLIRIWDLATLKTTGVLAGQSGLIEQAIPSPDGKFIASASWDSSSRVWDLASGREIRKLEPVNGCQTVAFSADGRTVATGSMDRMIRVWELATGGLRCTLEGHRGAVAGLAFLPDGTLVSGSSDGTGLVWDLRSRRAPQALTAEEVEAEWKHLHGGDVARAYRALWALAASPIQALAKLQKELQPTPRLDSKDVDRWIADLDNNKYEVRQKAMAELKRAGDVTWPALRKVLDQRPTLEVRARVLVLLGRMEDPVPVPERLGLIRELELLEHLGTPQARQLVQALADGAPEGWLTGEAKSMLKRFKSRG
jgi:WD40 repeat protein